MTIYHNPKNEVEMDIIYVVLSRDKDGTEGICSMMTPMGGMPLIFGHERMLENIIPSVKQMAKDTGKTIRIYKFKKDDLLHEISGSN